MNLPRGSAIAVLFLLCGCPQPEAGGDVEQRSAAALTEIGDAPAAGSVPDLPARAAIPGAPADAVVADGEVEPANFAEVRIDVPGTVARIFVDSGDPVRKGDVLAELETVDREERLAEARRRLRDARASSIGGTRTGDEPPEWLKSELRRRLESAESRARSEDYDRRRIVEAGLSGDEHEAAEKAVAIAAVRNRGARSGTAARRAAEERIAAALVDELGGRVRGLEDDIAKSVVRAPISGQIVSVRLSEGGQWNTRNVDPAFEILDPASLVIRAAVPVGLAKVMREREIVWLDLGDGASEPVEGMVSEIDEQELRVSGNDGEFSTVRHVRFTVTPAVSRRLEIGQPVRVAVRR
ncbi:MAG: biotin/lipoyl-binding protein [Proteobacteria bacterium]|nr:biotin/lipoyl-binding protein [Pseudomonadota bacterium]